jgi:hypothetical protein
MTDDVSTELAKIFMRTGDLTHAPKLAVIGDSHSLFFAGVEKMADEGAIVPAPHTGVRVYYVGAGLAASLVKPWSRNRSREKVLMALEDVRNTGLKQILFSFGEIDCRYHIRERCIRKNADTHENWLLSAQITAARYIAFLLEVRFLGFQPAIAAPPPSTPHPPDAHQWLTYGTMMERNWLTRGFTTILKNVAAQHGIPVVSVFEELVDEKLNSKPDYSGDQVHLSQKHWNLWVEKARAAGIVI